MLTVRIPQPALARTEDRRIYDLAYVLPTEGAGSSCSSSGSTTATTSTQNSSGSQRSIGLVILQTKKRRASQKQNDKDLQKVCFVCWSKDCKLKSHQEYASRQKTKASDLPKSTPQRSPQLVLPIGKGRLDPFTALPVEEPSKDVLRLFHDFFTNQASVVYEYPRRLAFDSTYLSFLIQQAYSDSATCYSCIAMSATYTAVHGQNLNAPDDKLSAIYEAALRALRAQLIREKSRPRSTTVSAAVNLIMAQAIGMGNREALVAHRTGIHTFVKAWGGLHNFEPQMVTLIIWTDYWATLFTGLPPLYTDLLSGIDVKLERPLSRTCGFAFEEPRMRGIVSPMLLENCQTTCRLIELVEDRVRGMSSPSKWQYWTYKRDDMATRSAVVHSDLFGTGSKAECISIAMNLVLCLILRMVPWKTPAIELCGQMKKAVLASGAAVDFWRTDIDVLLYVLFVTSASGTYWDDKLWTIQLLQETLEMKYGSIRAGWPDNWDEQEIYNLMRFAWSDILLKESFQETCRELDLNRHCDFGFDLDEGCELADDEGSE